MDTLSIGNKYTPAEALWAMYMSQSKAVRKAFRMRLRAEEEAEEYRKKMEAYAKTLPEEELEAAEFMAKSIKRSVAEVQKAVAEGRPAGRPAEELLEELMNVMGESRPVSVSREISKLHAETVRGTLQEVHHHFASKEVKGEIVVVVSGQGNDTPQEEEKVCNKE